MIKNIVLHTDRETMMKIKDQEKRFQESHQGLVDMVKQKHAQFDQLLEKMIQQSNAELSSVGDRTERERRPSSSSKIHTVQAGNSQKPKISVDIEKGFFRADTLVNGHQKTQSGSLTESSPLHDQEEKEIDAVEVDNSSEFLNL